MSQPMNEGKKFDWEKNSIKVAFSAILILVIFVFSISLSQPTKQDSGAQSIILNFLFLFFLLILFIVSNKLRSLFLQDMAQREKEAKEISEWTTRVKQKEFQNIVDARKGAPSWLRGILLILYPGGIPSPYYMDTPIVVTSVDAATFTDQQFEEKFESTLISRFNGALTGLSLFFTFALISPAVIEVGKAITGGDGTNTSLTAAITSIGAKFVLSASGVLLTLALSFELHLRRKKFMKEAQVAIRALREVAYTREELDLVIQLDQLTEQKNTVKAVNSLSDIKVTLSSLSEEVSIRMGDIITRSIGDSIDRAMQSQAEGLNNIATALSNSVSQQLQTSMNELISSLKNELATISRGLNERGETNFGDAINMLIQAIEQGSGASADKLKVAVEALASEFPRIGKELSAVIGKLAEIQASANGSAEKNNNELTSRLDETLQKMAAAFENLQSNIKAAGVEMKGAYDQIRGEFLTTSQALTESGNELRNVLGQIKETSKEISQTSTILAPANESLATSTKTLSETANVLKLATEDLRKSPADFAAALQQAREAIDQQTQAIKSQASEWGVLFDRVQDGSMKLNETSQATWTLGEQNIRNAFGNLEDNLSELSEDIQSLTNTLIDFSQGIGNNQ